ncbi:MAG: T9SS type A sorting domain-containing protein [Ferruginibacter sp.]
MKRHFLLLFLAMTCITLYAQPVLQWQKNYGGSGGDTALSIKQTADGGYIVAGSSSSSNGDVSGNHGGADYWVAKLNAAGTIVWQRSYGGSGNDVAKYVQPISGGAYIVVGYTNSTNGDITDRASSLNCYDAWALKLDTFGNIIWKKSIYGQVFPASPTINAYANTVIQTTDGGFLIGGFREANPAAPFPEPEIYVNTYLFTWVVKLNTSGTFVWESKTKANFDHNIAYAATDWYRNIDNSKNGGFVESLVQTSSGYTILAHGPYHPGPSGDCGWNFKNNTYIFKLNLSGTLVWEHYYGAAAGSSAATNVCIGKAMRSTSDGGFIIAGYSNATNGCLTGAGNHGLKDFWLFKITSTGTLVWSKNYGGSDNDFAFDVEQSPDGSYYITGASSSYDGQVTGHSPAPFSIADYWVVKANSSGTFIWGKCYGATPTDNAYACTKTTDGSWVVAGSSFSSFGSVVNKSGSDWMLTKFTDCAILPPTIPASTQLFFNCRSPKVSNLSPNGATIKWYTTPTGGTALASTAALPTGSYTYYASQKTAALGCVETGRSPANITVSTMCPAFRPGNNNEEIITKAIIWPNPNKGSFQFYLVENAPDKVSVQLVDVYGKIVLQKNFIAVNGRIRQNILTANLSAGIYFLQFNTTKGINTQKIIIEK